jgi:hypothetical protein
MIMLARFPAKADGSAGPYAGPAIVNECANDRDVYAIGDCSIHGFSRTQDTAESVPNALAQARAACFRSLWQAHT